MVKFSLLPREQKFFDLYMKSASNVVKIARMLKDLVEKCDDMEGRTAKITEAEEAEDQITHQIIADIHRTFVTPFDREDMAKLADSLDDITDFIEGAAESMHLYRAECPVQGAREMADVIVRMAIEVEKAVTNLGQRRHLERILDQCVEIHKLETEADRIFRTVRAQLFDNPPDLAYVIKWHEIYQLMEDATDRCDDAANVLEGIVIKYA